jgi:uncharacterized protein
MATYLHPGVYIEEIPSGVKTIEGVSTSIAAFVGPARRGPIGEATLVHSLDDYTATYGDVHDPNDAMGLSVTAYYQNGGKDAYIARLASVSPPATAASARVTGEETGAADVLVVRAASVGGWGNELRFRIAKASATAQTFTLEIGHVEGGDLVVDEEFADLSMVAGSDDFVLTRVNGLSGLVTVSLVEAADPEDAAHQYQKGSLTGAQLDTDADLFATGVTDGMRMTLNVDGLGPEPIVLDTAASLDLEGDNAADGAKLAAAIEEAVAEIDPTEPSYADFSVEYTDRRFLLTSGSRSSSSSVVVFGGDGSDTDLAAFAKLDPDSGPVAVRGASKVVPKAVAGPGGAGVPLEGGAEAPPTASDYRSFFGQKLVKIRDASIIVLPGQFLPKSGGNDAVAAAVAHAETTKRSMVIIDPAPDVELAKGTDVEALALTTSTYGVLYYPWVEVSNPFAKPGDGSKSTIAVAPSAFAAGMWAKIDGRRGVWKAPAGVETSLLGVAALRFDVGDGEQDQLNPLGVNALRRLPGFGHVIWGSRTLSTKADPEWRYVPVRRTAIFIEQSIYNSIQWAVFEPNGHNLWASLRTNIDAFLNGLWRSGAFQGEKASDAYHVRCGLGDTMTQADIDRGQVIVIVAFAPLKPAEFVIVRIQQKVAQQ